jgi:hypothetical protein
LAGLTNYVIRHISKYGNIMTSFSWCWMPRKHVSSVPVQVPGTECNTHNYYHGKKMKYPTM